MIRGALTRTARDIALSALILGLVGCATGPELVLPDDALLADCPKAGIKGVTNLDLAVGFNDRGRNIDECNADKAALRAWRDALRG